MEKVKKYLPMLAVALVAIWAANKIPAVKKLTGGAAA